jgi:hypothetical protein
MFSNVVDTSAINRLAVQVLGQPFEEHIEHYNWSFRALRDTFKELDHEQTLHIICVLVPRMLTGSGGDMFVLKDKVDFLLACMVANRLAETSAINQAERNSIVSLFQLCVFLLLSPVWVLAGVQHPVTGHPKKSDHQKGLAFPGFDVQKESQRLS